MSRHIDREKAMIATYQYLLFDREVDGLLEDAYGCSLEEIDPYFVNVVKNSIEQLQTYKDYIEEVLDGWKFDRLGMIEKAILLNGCSEFALKKIASAIIIDESVELAKTYCESDAYKLINRVLDII